MRKELFILSLFVSLLVLNLGFIYSADAPVLPASAQIAINAPNITGDLVGSSNKVLESNVVIPSTLEVFAKLALGITNDNPVSVDELIILMCLWVILLLIIKTILEFIPFFEDGWKSWFGAIIITLLSSMTGWMRSLSHIWFTFGSFFKGQSTFNILANVIILGFFTWAAIIILKIIKKKASEEESEMLGFKTGMK